MLRALALSLLLVPTLAAQAARAAIEIDWRSDFTAARQAALQQHKPLLVVFRCER